MFVNGDIVIWGGTSAPVNTIGVTSTLANGTIVQSSFDRLWLQNVDPLFPNATNWNAVANSWQQDLNGNWLLAGGAITLNSSRGVAGPMTVVSGSNLRNGTVLKAGTSVADPADRLEIDPSLAKFGYGTSDANTLSAIRTFPAASGDYVLTGDITIPVATGIGTGSLGYGTVENDKTMLNESRLFATSAAAVLCVGTCSSFGGIPAATGNKTGAAGALYKGLTKPTVHNGALTEFAAKTINISGCPPHSDWIVGTVAYLLARSLQALPPLEAYGRPIDYYGMYQCNAGPCEWRYNQGYKIADETSLYANPKGPLTPNPVNASYGIPANTTINSSKLYKFKWNSIVSTGLDNGKRPVGCIGVLGCKGRKTKADCSLRRWNADAAGKYGSGWCVSSGAGCHGCTEPTFPDKVGKFFNFA
jgi:Ni,Fe-hydrogenase I small subunit